MTRPSRFVDPLPVLLVRRGTVSPRAIAALQRDRRLELFIADELTPEAISFSQRVAAVIVATDGDPLCALAYAATAGVSGPVVVALASRFRGERVRLAQAGAVACVTMPVTSDGIGRLIPVLRKHSPLAYIHSSLHLMLDPIGRVVRYQDRTVRLSQREFAVLHCLSASQGRPVEAQELVARVWGDGVGRVRPRQILDVYVHQLRRKLHGLGLSNAISTVRRFGYALGNGTPAHVTR